MRSYYQRISSLLSLVFCLSYNSAIDYNKIVNKNKTMFIQFL